MKETRIDKFIGQKVILTEENDVTHYGVLHKIVDNKTETGEIRSINKGYYLEIEDNRGIDYRRSHIKSISKQGKEEVNLNVNLDLKDKVCNMDLKAIRHQVCNEIRKKMSDLYLVSEDEFNRIITEVENQI